MKIIILFLNILFITAFAKADKIDSLLLLIDSDIVSEKQIEYKLGLAKELSNTDINRAIIYAKEAREDALEIDCQRCIAESNFAVGKFYENLGEHFKALSYLEDALLLFGPLHDGYNKSQTVKLIGNIYYYSGEFDLALQYYLELVEFAQLINDTSLIIDGLILRGKVYGNVAKFDSAIVLFSQAHELCLKVNEPVFELQSLYFIGDVYLFSGNSNEALRVFNSIDENYSKEQTEIKQLANRYSSMAHAYFNLRDIDKAKFYLNKSWDMISRFYKIWSIRDYYELSFRVDTFEKKYESATENLILFKAYNDTINNSSFKEQLANFETLYDLQNKESQIDRLMVSNKLKDSEINQKKIVNYGFGILILVFLVFVLQVYKSRKEISSKNRELEDLIKELNATQQNLVQSEKMASLGTLTAGVAHELNNPLNFISGGVFMLQEIEEEIKSNNSEEVKDKLNIVLRSISEGIDRASTIVKSLMTFSYKGDSKLIDSNIHEIIDSTLLFLKSKITDDIIINKDFKLSRNIFIFPEKMHQIIMNIIDNSVFALNQSDKENKVLNITTKEVGSFAEVVISNTGAFIGEDKLSQLFDPFYSTKSPREGTGLGLSICYSLIKEHKGDIFAKNTSNGVSFVIKIPLTK